MPKSEMGVRLQTATDDPKLYSATHRVRWHRTQAEGGWQHEITGLYYAKGKEITYTKRKRKRSENERQNNLV